MIENEEDLIFKISAQSLSHDKKNCVIKILSAAQIREADQYTISHEPIKSIDLMERAAVRFTELFTAKFPGPIPIFIFSGYGNNGGDGLAIARLLLQKNDQVQVYILADEKHYSEDFLINQTWLTTLSKHSVHEVVTDSDFPAITTGAIIIDALFGSGLNKPLHGLAASLVSYLNLQDATRISVDIPSGLFADAVGNGITFKAHFTFTFHQPKLAFLFPENQDAVGAWEAVDIGLDRHFIDAAASFRFLPGKEDILKIIHPRKKFDHKGTFGHAFIHAGSPGKMGASIMCAAACARSGAGLTTVFVPKNTSQILNTSIPEAMTEEYAPGKKIAADLSKYNAFAFGPGIGTDDAARAVFLSLLKRIEVPTVVDADALNIISREKKGLKLLPENSIITPHPKEFERLSGKTSNWLERHELQVGISKKHHVYIVLKGAYTCISTPAGNCYFNPTGNPGMAKGGSGDVLTGIIAGLLAQHYSPEEACLLGVYLHGLSADMAVRNKSVYSLLATDIISNIGNAFSEITGQSL